MTKLTELIHLAIGSRQMMADDERGQGLVEYALIIALVAIACIAALVILGGDISNTLNEIGGNLR